jgi:hypothetical protein
MSLNQMSDNQMSVDLMPVDQIVFNKRTWKLISPFSTLSVTEKAIKRKQLVCLSLCRQRTNPLKHFWGQLMQNSRLRKLQKTNVL